MRRPTKLIALLVCAGAFAQDSAPKLTDGQRARYWRAQAEAVAAQARAAQAVATFQAVQAELVKACGGQLIGAPDGEPACAPATGSK